MLSIDDFPFLGPYAGLDCAIVVSVLLGCQMVGDAVVSYCLVPWSSAHKFPLIRSFPQLRRMLAVADSRQLVFAEPVV